LLKGEGTVKRELPAMYRQYQRFGIDMSKDPILIYPTLHYQNGGIAIKPDGSTKVPGLYVAGEASGGVHGRNRLYALWHYSPLWFDRNNPARGHP
jgi:succinate dehydrogenase / fumarate reductase flavoprotein subunit